MTDERQEEAETLAARAGTQAKNAAKNAGRAAKAEAEVIADELKDEAHKAEETVKDAAQAAKGIDVSGFLLDLSVGTGALGLSLFFGAAAFRAFKNAPTNLKR